MLSPRDVQEFVNDYAMWVVLGLLVSTLFVAYRWRSKLPRMSMRDITMTVEGRRVYVQKVVLERICDALLDCYLDGQLTADEANLQLAVLAKFYKHEELIPLIDARRNRLMKKRLRDSNRRRTLNGKTDSLPIPGPKPGEDVPTKKVDTSSILASILAS